MPKVSASTGPRRRSGEQQRGLGDGEHAEGRARQHAAAVAGRRRRGAPGRIGPAQRAPSPTSSSPEVHSSVDRVDADDVAGAEQGRAPEDEGDRLDHEADEHRAQPRVARHVQGAGDDRLDHQQGGRHVERGVGQRRDLPEDRQVGGTHVVPQQRDEQGADRDDDRRELQRGDRAPALGALGQAQDADGGEDREQQPEEVAGVRRGRDHRQRVQVPPGLAEQPARAGEQQQPPPGARRGLAVARGVRDARHRDARAERPRQVPQPQGVPVGRDSRRRPPRGRRRTA